MFGLIIFLVVQSGGKLLHINIINIFMNISNILSFISLYISFLYSHLIMIKISSSIKLFFKN